MAVAVVKFLAARLPRTTPVVSAAVPNKPIVRITIAVNVSIKVNPRWFAAGRKMLNLPTKECIS
jgi:hypothetical protein